MNDLKIGNLDERKEEVKENVVFLRAGVKRSRHKHRMSYQVFWKQRGQQTFLDCLKILFLRFCME
jgi:hypothetical protein